MRSALIPLTFGLTLVLAPLRADTAPAGEWTDTQFPDFIEKVTDFGERADWSHDGRKFLFVERSFGDVYEYDLATRRYRPLTHHYYHGGYARALYLSNGDILLSGPADFPGGDWRTARFKLSELWVLDRSLTKPPVRLGQVCWEGPAVSRTRLRLAWSQYEGEKHGFGARYRIRVGDLDYSSGEPRLTGIRVVLSNDLAEIKDRTLEPQNFRPGREQELTVQVSQPYSVYSVNVETGALTRQVEEADCYNEPEGIFPDGRRTLVESSRHTGRHDGANIDLWSLQLEPGQPAWERLTWFNAGGKYKASNPVVSDDGRFIAFQVAGRGEVAGIGHGIYVLDLRRWKSPAAPAP